METKQEPNAITAELDEFHAIAQRAYRARDIDAYRSLFTDDLRYLQPDGKAIGLDQLMRDVAKQFSQLKAADSVFTRKSLTTNEDGTAVEVLNQKAVYSVSVFLIFTKTWTMERRGKYTFRKTAAGWQVCRVEVLSEALS